MKAFFMKYLPLLCGIVLSGVTMQQAAGASENVGVRQIVAPSRERGVNLDVTVWYPAQAGGKEVTLGENAFFVGTPAMRDAPIVDAKFPLILLSHGAGLAGSAQALSWIAAPLAKRGFIVAAPTHPGNAGADRSPAETIRLWVRPADIIETLEAMEKDPLFKKRFEQGKIGALGLSMGGSTALSIAGARLDPKLLAGYCDTDALNPSFCGWAKQRGIDLHTLDFSSAGRDNEDKRIRFVMVVDPAPVDVFAFESFSRISVPVELVNLGKVGEIPATVQASEIAKAIPGATYSAIREASHYSMFAECKPGASELAESEEIDEPICTDGEGNSRHEIHTQLINMAAGAFTRALKTNP